MQADVGDDEGNPHEEMYAYWEQRWDEVEGKVKPRNQTEQIRLLKTTLIDAVNWPEGSYVTVPRGKALELSASGRADIVNGAVERAVEVLDGLDRKRHDLATVEAMRDDPDYDQDDVENFIAHSKAIIQEVETMMQERPALMETADKKRKRKRK